MCLDKYHVRLNPILGNYEMSVVVVVGVVIVLPLHAANNLDGTRKEMRAHIE